MIDWFWMTLALLTLATMVVLALVMSGRVDQHGYGLRFLREYIKGAREHGWSPWPAYAMVPLLVLMVIFLQLAGVYRLLGL